MSRVVIHRLAGTKKALEACRLVESLFNDGKRVVAWIADSGRAELFDQYLWTFAQHSFVPHALWGGAGEVDDPVVVVSGTLTNPNQADVLVIGDILTDLEPAGAFPEIHDLVTSSSEDAGKVEAWKAAGFQVEEA